MKGSVVNKSHTVLDRTDEQSKQEGSWTVGKSNERLNLNPKLVNTCFSDMLVTLYLYINNC